MRGGPEVRRLGRRDCDAALRILSDQARDNLLLLDLVDQLASGRSTGEPRPEVVGAFRGRDLVGVATLRPTVVVGAAADESIVDAFVPLVSSLDAGLVKCSLPAVDRLWKALEARGRRAFVDRRETAYWLRPGSASMRPGDARVRAAVETDLEDLVFAARASLREEARPDPFEGDPAAFRRWVAARLSRALLVEDRAGVGFVGYADVQRPEGWLLQGVYTWSPRRRQGLAAAGVSALCRAAFAHGADHVQLAVVEGNQPAEGLYQGLGFAPFARLRTILFS
jgi:RimJ/RimL family protein N-acetyltransferase